MQCSSRWLTYHNADGIKQADFLRCDRVRHSFGLCWHLEDRRLFVWGWRRGKITTVNEILTNELFNK